MLLRGSSLSARRAWIEILLCSFFKPSHKVALRKESVDRNNDILRNLFYRRLSLSARRAWIEMFFLRSLCAMSRVALRKESVDRNIKLMPLTRFSRGRSLSARRAWIEILLMWYQCNTVVRRSPQGERG